MPKPKKFDWNSIAAMLKKLADDAPELLAMIARLVELFNEGEPRSTGKLAGCGLDECHQALGEHLLGALCCWMHCCHPDPVPPPEPTPEPTPEPEPEPGP